MTRHLPFSRKTLLLAVLCFFGTRLAMWVLMAPASPSIAAVNLSNHHPSAHQPALPIGRLANVKLRSKADRPKPLHAENKQQIDQLSGTGDIQSNRFIAADLIHHEQLATPSYLGAPQPNSQVSKRRSTRSPRAPERIRLARPRRMPTRMPLPAFKQPLASRDELHSMAQERLRAAEESFRRGIPLFAREQAKQSLTYLAEATDAASQTNRGTNALSVALTAIREAADFLGRFGPMEDTAMRRLVDSHQTLVLRSHDLSRISRYQAAQAYHELATKKLAESLAATPIASRVLTLIAETEPYAVRDNRQVSTATQTCYLRAATSCNPGDAKAHQALGASFLNQGLHANAQEALETSHSLDPHSVETLRSLATTYHALGYQQAAAECLAKSKSIAASRTKRKGLVVQLAPSQFAKISHQQIIGDHSPIVPAALNTSPSRLEQTFEPGPVPEHWPGKTARRISQSIQSFFR